MEEVGFLTGCVVGRKGTRLGNRSVCQVNCRRVGGSRRRWGVISAAVEDDSQKETKSEEVAAEEKWENSLPPLYDGWFSMSGVIAKQVQTALQASVSGGQRKFEVYFPPVPNVDEVKFGTKLNSMFAEDMARYFDMEEDVRKVKRYMIEFANYYWAARIAEAFPERPVHILATNAVKKDEARVAPNVENVAPLNRVNFEIGDSDIVIVSDPGPNENWKRGAKFAGKDRIVIMLNSSFVETYDLNGPLKDFEQVYFLKRISKGWVYRCYPQPWICYLERPDGSVEILDEKEKRPTLGQVSKLLRDESFRRYSIYNDRWSPGFGARL